VEAPQEMRRLVNGYQVSEAIRVAAALRVSDLLADGPRDLADLADASGCHSDAMYRLLRALASIGVYEELPDRRFGTTPLGETLESGRSESLAPWAEHTSRPYVREAWAGLLDSVRTGENAFARVHGQSVWEYRAEHPEEGALFDAGMVSFAATAARQVLDAYDFAEFATVVDVGGGHGGLLAAILDRNPAQRGVLFDQSHVLAGASALLRARGVDDRCQLVAGSFFDSVPSGGDGYVLKSIVHDWEDAEALTILRNCRGAMNGSALLLLVERDLGEANQSPAVKFSDLNMFVSPGGRERTEEEYDALLSASGFRRTRTVPTAGDVMVIEAALV
jgi:hypothetical protein